MGDSAHNHFDISPRVAEQAIEKRLHQIACPPLGDGGCRQGTSRAAGCSLPSAPPPASRARHRRPAAGSVAPCTAFNLHLGEERHRLAQPHRRQFDHQQPTGRSNL